MGVADLWVLQERGRLHEEAYIRHLKDQGLSVQDLRVTAADAIAAEATRISMESGVEVIVQPTFVSDPWYGRADILRRVGTSSTLGPWSYKVYDCKLSTETKAGTILQLSIYSEMVGAIQGLVPESMYVVPPVAPISDSRFLLVFKYEKTGRPFCPLWTIGRLAGDLSGSGRVSD